MMSVKSLAFFTLLLFITQTLGYDTGHHNDLTRNTLQLYGYNNNAQLIGGIANYFVDYYALTPISSEHLPELLRMHFDNVFTMKNASNYWTQLAINSKSAIQQAATSGDVLAYLMTIGGTMHSVQDFYTHSNWVDFYYRTGCDCYRAETWINVVHQSGGDLNVFLENQGAVHTYSYGNCDENSRNCLGAQLPHGSSCLGINKDSYLRPYWEPSYAFAFSATVEWLENIHEWTNEVNTEMIDLAKNYVPPSQTEMDQLIKLDDLMHVVSYAIKWRENDGHWKGSGSGSLGRFIPSSLEFIKTDSVYKQKFVEQQLYLRWTVPNVYDAPGVNAAEIVDLNTIRQITTPHSVIGKFTPVVVRTLAVRGEDSRNTPSYFATVNIDGMEFVENVQIDFASFDAYWTSIKFVPIATTSVPIVYTLKNNKYPRSDEIVSITPSGSDSLSLSYDVASHSLSGDVTGVFDSSVNTFKTKNANKNVEVELFVTTYNYATCSEGLPQQYCANEAYVHVGAFLQCEGEAVADQGAASSLSCSLSLCLIAILLFIF